MANATSAVRGARFLLVGLGLFLAACPSEESVRESCGNGISKFDNCWKVVDSKTVHGSVHFPKDSAFDLEKGVGDSFDFDANSSIEYERVWDRARFRYVDPAEAELLNQMFGEDSNALLCRTEKNCLLGKAYLPAHGHKESRASSVFELHHVLFVWNPGRYGPDGKPKELDFTIVCFGEDCSGDLKLAAKARIGPTHKGSGHVHPLRG